MKTLPFSAGCTACVCLITPDSVYCANAGDSRAILVNKAGKVTELSFDHKPENDGEMKRIKAGGGFVEDGRVQGIIAVSRAIGDWEYKNPQLQFEKKMTKKKKKGENGEAKAGGPYRNIEEAKKHQVSSFPDVMKVGLKNDFDFIIVACDGIWDCFTNEQAAKFARTKREKGPKVAKQKTKSIGSRSAYSSSPSKIQRGKTDAKKQKPKGETSFIIEEMMDHGIAKGDITMSDGTGTDNMTCVMVQFRDPDEVAREREANGKEEAKAAF